MGLPEIFVFLVFCVRTGDFFVSTPPLVGWMTRAWQTCRRKKWQELAVLQWQVGAVVAVALICLLGNRVLLLLLHYHFVHCFQFLIACSLIPL